MTSTYKTFDEYIQDNFNNTNFTSVTYDKYFDYVIQAYIDELCKLGKESFLESISSYFSLNVIYELLEYIYLHNIQIFQDNDIQLFKDNDIQQFYDKMDAIKIPITISSIIEYAPNNLKTTAKLCYLKNLVNDQLNGEDFIKFLKYQTHGGDYVNFDYIIKYYKLELDKNGMIIFTKDFPFDKSINKEALIIWWLLNLLKKNTILVDNGIYLLHTLQNKLETNILRSNENMRYDLCFKYIKLYIEINEDYHLNINVIEKDIIKKSLTMIKIVKLLIFEFSQIENGQIYISEYLEKFSLNFINIVLYALEDKNIIELDHDISSFKLKLDMHHNNKMTETEYYNKYIEYLCIKHKKTIDSKNLYIKELKDIIQQYKENL
jgi:hypothetical protein